MGALQRFSSEIHDAASNGDPEKIKVRLKTDHGLVFSKDDTGETPLDFAAMEGHTDVAELLANKSEVNAKDKEGAKPTRLVWACNGDDLTVSHGTWRNCCTSTAAASIFPNKTLRRVVRSSARFPSLTKGPF
jgi:ankyrin repeat protein